jgi:hypothetical protein
MKNPNPSPQNISLNYKNMFWVIDVMTLVNQQLAGKSQSCLTSSWYIGFQISISVKK